MLEPTALERWFDKLIKNKMTVPALAFAGIAGGLMTAQASIFIQGQIGNAIAGVGFFMTAISATVFLVYLVRRLSAD